MRTAGRSEAEGAGGRENLGREEAEGGEIFPGSGFAQTASACERASKATALVEVIELMNIIGNMPRVR